jgi:hypothetical protein
MFTLGTMVAVVSGMFFLGCTGKIVKNVSPHEYNVDLTCTEQGANSLVPNPGVITFSDKDLKVVKGK